MRLSDLFLSITGSPSTDLYRANSIMTDSRLLELTPFTIQYYSGMDGQDRKKNSEQP